MTTIYEFHPPSIWNNCTCCGTGCDCGCVLECSVARNKQPEGWPSFEVDE